MVAEVRGLRPLPPTIRHSPVSTALLINICNKYIFLINIAEEDKGHMLKSYVNQMTWIDLIYISNNVPAV